MVSNYLIEPALNNFSFKATNYDFLSQLIRLLARIGSIIIHINEGPLPFFLTVIKCVALEVLIYLSGFSLQKC